VRFLIAVWIVVVGASIVAERIVISDRLRLPSLDAQLIRLVMRFLGVAIAMSLLIEGVDEFGFPAYSVLPRAANGLGTQIAGEGCPGPP
jgi:hypothetical protein